jgi:hypothetical protein
MMHLIWGGGIGGGLDAHQSRASGLSSPAFRFPDLNLNIIDFGTSYLIYISYPSILEYQYPLYYLLNDVD